jgi:hypothetical protein
MADEEITFSRHVIGLAPYVLIQAGTDDSDELALTVNYGGGVETERIGYLPMLMLIEIPAAHNPLTEAADRFMRGYDGHPGSVVEDVLREFAKYVGFPFPGDEG